MSTCDENILQLKAVVYEILQQICKKRKKACIIQVLDDFDNKDQFVTFFHNARFEDLQWILTKVNCRLLKRYNLIISDSIFKSYIWADAPMLVPEYFDTDWGWDYWINCNATHYSHMSKAVREAIENSIKKWKLYGKILVRFQTFCFKMKSKYINKKGASRCK